MEGGLNWVWPPPINRRRKRTISGKIVAPFVDRAPSGCGACFGVCGCCLVVAMCARAGGPPAAQRPPAPRAVRRRRAAAAHPGGGGPGGGGPPPPNGRRIFVARDVNLGRAAGVWWCFVSNLRDDDCSGWKVWIRSHTKLNFSQNPNFGSQEGPIGLAARLARGL